ncbi:unnamed protein product [Thlaspi arvense]|uniref:Uncharacterized protein n=1 Tax=Thlaspi arvense TaxID=13288 RepID=A0AAU9RKZ6_THLAR|nr:unnamed protein product [Thlaspi arvense]
MEEVTDERTHTLVEQEKDEDDTPMLSAQALEALKEFLAEQNRALAPGDGGGGGAAAGGLEKEVVLLAEDWRLSQFWYDRETAEAVSEEVLYLCDSICCPSVACLACPTLYAYLKNDSPFKDIVKNYWLESEYYFQVKYFYDILHSCTNSAYKAFP